MSANSRKKKSRNNLKTAGQQIADMIMVFLTMAYVVVMLCIYPLYFHDKYFDMGDSKYEFFRWFSLVAMGLLIAGLVFFVIVYREEIKWKELHKQISLTDGFVLAFCVLSIASYLASAFKDTALWGYSGWYMGLMSQLIFVAAYFFVSRYWEWSDAVLKAALIVAAICYQMAILQRFGFNPLGMYDNVGDEDIMKFLSTLGQTSWYSSYAILILPLGMYMYWNSQDKDIKSRVLYGLFTALGFGMICTTNSDSAYMAIVFILLVFFRYSLESNAKFLRFLEMLIIGLASFKIIGLLHATLDEREYHLFVGTEDMTIFMTESKFMYIPLLAVIAIYAVFRYIAGRQKKNEGFDIANYRKLIWNITLALTVIVAAVAVYLVFAVTGGKIASLADVSILNFDNAWGNHRGFNWRMAWRAFRSASGKDFLIGVGPDCFADAMNEYCYEDVSVYWHGQALACAHNEWFNMLVTQGILGVIAYIGIFVSAILRGAKTAKKNPVVIPFMALIAAYMSHNFFCYQQCICTPVVFIAMAMIELQARWKGEPESRL